MEKPENVGRHRPVAGSQDLDTLKIIPADAFRLAVRPLASNFGVGDTHDEATFGFRPTGYRFASSPNQREADKQARCDDGNMDRLELHETYEPNKTYWVSCIVKLCNESSNLEIWANDDLRLAVRRCVLEGG